MKHAVRNEVQDMVEKIHVGADEGRESKRTKTNVPEFVDHFLLLIHQSSDQPCSKLSRLPTLETTPRKYINAVVQRDLKPKKTEENFDPFQSGGLDNDNASSVCPNFLPRHAQGLSRTYAFHGTLPEPEVKDLKWDHLQKNNVGTFVFLFA